jgi:hemerythrin superfamily protein
MAMNALTLLKQDHNNVDQLFARFEQSDDPIEKRQIVDKVIEHLSVHAVIEEEFVYPAARKAIEEATGLVLEALEEHHLVKVTLWELEKMAPTDERFDAKMTVLIESVRHHVEEEENELFPQIREAMTQEELDELGTTLENAKLTAPTRPHPLAPDTPPLNMIVGLPVAVLDAVITTGKEALGKVLNRR